MSWKFFFFFPIIIHIGVVLCVIGFSSQVQTKSLITSKFDDGCCYWFRHSCDTLMINELLLLGRTGGDSEVYSNGSSF